MDDDDDGLLNIHLCDSDDEQSAKKRTGQSEDAFQAVKAGYRPKRQNGNVRLVSPRRTLFSSHD